ncbi:hypothetical protein BC832DRAFT_421890 [Gaertneriomyces semiglobifer]|nr:hypothetical protein BC832DRAFT_421890 [Gaertneriomyces semiglobifer]
MSHASATEFWPTLAAKIKIRSKIGYGCMQSIFDIHHINCSAERRPDGHHSNKVGAADAVSTQPLLPASFAVPTQTRQLKIRRQFLQKRPKHSNKSVDCHGGTVTVFFGTVTQRRSFMRDTVAPKYSLSPRSRSSATHQKKTVREARARARERERVDDDHVAGKHLLSQSFWLQCIPSADFISGWLDITQNGYR